MPERVQKIIAQWGIASRRQAEEMILAGRVKLNGQPVQLGQKAELKRDRLEVDGRLIKPKNRPDPVYLLLNKPKGVISTCNDPQGRKTVLHCLPRSLRNGQGIHPVGRLDIDSSGAILLTNDGDLTLKLTHPRYHLPKTYHVWVSGHPTSEVIKQWQKGVQLSGKYTLPALIQVLSVKSEKTLLKIILKEGRNRQIRRVAEQLGHRVLNLHRSAIGRVRTTPPGQTPLRFGDYRFLVPWEISEIGQPLN